MHEATENVQARIELHRKIQGVWDLLTSAIEEHVHKDGRRVAAICVLYSGGNDSTILAHLVKGGVDCAVHINTGIGIEETRNFVRTTCADWGLPLIEEHGDDYRELVLDQGFPGPAHHWKMYQRLKERGLRKVRRRFVKDGHKERVVFIAGRRRDESERRAKVPSVERVDSVVWVSPLADWTDEHMKLYREMFPDVPRNPVTEHLHMSGECLCGAFAKKGELDEIAFFFPETAQVIRELEQEVAEAGIPEPRCQWGWGADAKKKKLDALRLGPLCHQCSLFDEEV